MLLKEVAIGINRVRATGVLPVAILAELRDAHMRLAHQLAVRMALNEVIVGFDGVGRFGGAPILLLPAAAPESKQQTDPHCSNSCPDCDHRQHLHVSSTGYCALKGEATVRHPGPQRLE
jgi:hypothetical protein